MSLAVAGCMAAASPSRPQEVASPSALESPGPSASERGTASSGPPSSLQEAVDQLASQAGSAVIGLVETPSESWRGAAGETGAGGPPDPTARFGIASTTKTFTATVVLQLVGEGQLSLEDTVEAWLPGAVTEGETITIRQLLNHTSGLSMDDRDGPPANEPGTRHSYSNGGYMLLGDIVEAVTGKPIDVEVGERLIGPLRLAATTYGTPSSPPSGAGGIVSTADDLATFFGALMRGELLEDEELAEMLATVSTEGDALAGRGTIDPEAGLGIFRFELDCGPAWGHGGDIGGVYSNQVLASPDGETIVIVAQDGGGWPSANATAVLMFCL